MLCNILDKFNWSPLLLLSLWWLWAIPQLPAQSHPRIDSLKVELERVSNDSLRVDILNQLGELFVTWKAKEALLYLGRAEELSKVIDYNRGRAEALYQMGVYYENMDKPDRAISKFNMARSIAETQKNIPTIAHLLLRVAQNYEKLEDRENSTFFYFKAARFYGQIQDYTHQEQAYRAIAQTFLELDKHKEALHYFEQSLELARRTKQNSVLILALIHVGSTNSKLGKYREAITYLEEAIQINQEKENPSATVLIHNTFGEVYGNLDAFQRAENATFKALKIAQKINDRYLVSQSYNILANIYKKQERYFEALEYQKLALNLSTQLGYTDQAIDYYLKVSNIYFALADYRNALDYHQKYTQLQDSIYNQNTLESIYQTAIKYQSKEKELEISELKTQKRISEEKLRQRRTINYSLGLGLILILTFTFFLYRSNQRIVSTNSLLKERNHQIEQQKEEISYQKSSLERFNKELAQKNRKLVELDQEKNHLIGVVAHDLRSPINQVKGLMEIIRLSGDNLNEEQTHHINLALSSLQRLDKMINRILDVNAMEQSEGNIQLEQIDLGDILNEIVYNFKDVAARKNIEIIREIPFEQHFAYLDESYALQIFENLISNAIKFSPEGKKIYVVLTELEDKIRVMIKDEGPGFAPEDRKALYGKFKKLSAKPTAGEASTGLGLSIVKKYVDLMKGQIQLESESGKGATFIVDFERSAVPDTH